MKDATFNNNERFNRIEKMNTGELQIWLTREKEYWSSIHDILAHREDEKANTQNVSNYLSAISNATYENLNSLENYHQSEPLPFHDEVPNSQQLLELANRGHFSLAIYAFSTSLTTKSNYYIKTYENDLLKTEQDLKIAIETEKNRFTETLNERLEKLNTSIDTTQKTAETNLQKKLDSSESKINETARTATSEIFAAEPVRYWLAREEKHKKDAAKFLKIISAAASAFLIFLAYLVASIYKNGEPYKVGDFEIPMPEGKYSIALVIIATTSAIWLIRILVKLMMTNLALEIEALERTTMIRTFLAINKTQAEKSEEIQMLFYSTLLKPSSNNLTDDSSSPEHLRIIEALLQKKS